MGDHRPRRIVLVRHGESQGNVDETIYETVPDHALHLTARGRAQAVETGRQLRGLLGGESLRMWVSPYVRARETAELLGLVSPDEMRLEPRLREQDWANFQDPAKIAGARKERDSFGHFYYRFESGESGADVFDRVSSFMESLFRSFQEPDMEDNVVVVTHGLTMRLFCMRWFRWRVEYFESLSNPDNAEVKVFDRGEGGHYRLDRPFARWDASVLPTPRERASWE